MQSKKCHCSSKPNHKLSKFSQSVPVTGIIVLCFAHLFSIVHLGSPSMTYKTINSKGFVPDCEQIYFKLYRYRRKQAWVGEKVPNFTLCPSAAPSAAPSPAVDSFASSCLPNIQTINVSAKCGSVFWCAEQTVFCHNASGCYSYKWLIARAKRQTEKV